MSRTYRREMDQRWRCAVAKWRADLRPTPAELARLDARRETARNWIDRQGIKPLDQRASLSDAFVDALRVGGAL